MAKTSKLHYEDLENTVVYVEIELRPRDKKWHFYIVGIDNIVKHRQDGALSPISLFSDQLRTIMSHVNRQIKTIVDAEKEKIAIRAAPCKDSKR